MKKGFPRRPPASRPPLPSGNAHPTPGLTLCPAPSTSWAWLQGLSPELGFSLALGAVNHEAATPLITRVTSSVFCLCTFTLGSFSQTY